MKLGTNDDLKVLLTHTGLIVLCVGQGIMVSSHKAVWWGIDHIHIQFIFLWLNYYL